MRVIIADDAVIVRQGVARLLAERGIEVVGEAGRTEELLRLVAALRPDVAIIDIRMPPTQTDEGLVAAREIRRRFPAVGTLVLSQHAESGYAFELIAGADGSVGYLLKDRVVEVTSSWTPSNGSGPAEWSWSRPSSTACSPARDAWACSRDASGRSWRSSPRARRIAASPWSWA